MQKKHAQHNEEVCNFLLTGGKYNDWVVTTAFYSAMHYLQHEIFPLNDQGITYKKFNHYYSQVYRNKISKHKCTVILVSAHASGISSRYKWLYNNCMTARYNNYQISSKTAEQAVNFLAEIKSTLKK